MFSAIASAAKGTCLDFTRQGPCGQQRDNETLFTTGSNPRELWTRRGHGATLLVEAQGGTLVGEEGSPSHTRCHHNTREGPPSHTRCHHNTREGPPSQGREEGLIDLSSMTQNCVLGINDEWVKMSQVAFLVSDHPHFVTVRVGFDLYYRYARRVLGLFHRACGLPESSDAFVVNHRSCNGSDAVELAVHAAHRARPAARRLASFEGSYHGQCLTACLVSEHQTAHFLVAPQGEDVVRFFPSPGLDADMDDATLEELSAHGDDYYAVLLEPIQVRNCVNVCPDEFLAKLRAVCDARGICLIFDEIQTGFGYLGGLCYAEVSGVVPDIACFSKGVTSGHGALALMFARRRYASLDPTFGGKTNSADVLGLVAANAVLDRLYGVVPDAGALPENLVGPRLAAELRAGLLVGYGAAVRLVAAALGRLQDEFRPLRLVGRIKGKGLVRGVEIVTLEGLPDEKMCAWVCNRGLAYGVYTRQAGHVVLVKPCIVITEGEMDKAEEGLRVTLREALHQR